MPRIKLKQGEAMEQVYVDENTLQQILDKIQDKNVKSGDLITIGNINFIKKEFKGFIKDNDPILFDGYDLSIPAHRQIINEFRQMLENLKTTSVLDKDLEYYGEVPKTFTREGVVKNPIIGFAHWSEVAWAEEEGLIGRYPQGNWFVALDPGVQKQMAAAKRFDAYKAKKKALEQMLDFEYNKQKEEKVKMEGVDF